MGRKAEEETRAAMSGDDNAAGRPPVGAQQAEGRQDTPWAGLGYRTSPARPLILCAGAMAVPVAAVDPSAVVSCRCTRVTRQVTDPEDATAGPGRRPES